MLQCIPVGRAVSDLDNFWGANAVSNLTTLLYDTPWPSRFKNFKSLTLPVTDLTVNGKRTCFGVKSLPYVLSNWGNFDVFWLTFVSKKMCKK